MKNYLRYITNLILLFTLSVISATAPINKIAPAFPELFLPGIVSTSVYQEFSCTISSDMKEFYFSRTGQFSNTTILVSYYKDGYWSDPKPAHFTNPEYRDLEPHLTADGTTLFFDSTRPKPGSSSPNNWGMWVVKRPDREAPWGNPEYFGQGMFLTTAKSGNLYYTDISTYRQSKGISVRIPLNDGYSAPTPLPQEVNRNFAAHPVIAPDESFIIFDAFYPDGQGKGNFPDYYIGFREERGSWSEAVNLGDVINGPLHNNCASISPDGRILFYSYEGDIFWLSAEFLQNLR
ncbi:MAG: PD40 domain-containing protein [Spirochaetia bacterium]|nr:PD40 domain-containing protein [Spirochaetia bacterium]